MSKNFFHKVLSFTMATVVVFSTFSFTVNRHYCGKSLVDTAIFFAAKNCGMEMQRPVENLACTISKKGCCSDDQLLVVGQDQLKYELSDFFPAQQLLVYTYISTYLIPLDGFDLKTPEYKAHAPPFLERAIYKLYDHYLIWFLNS